jgi:NDP-sugar pyrophosphorylase family protein
MMHIPDTAVVLAGSLATFQGLVLAPYPKILLPLANRPLVHYQAEMLAAAGVTRLILCVSSGMGPQLHQRLDSLPCSLEYLLRETRLGTGGSIREVQEAIRGDSFWVLNGDLLLGGGLADMLACHQQGDALATLGVLRVREAPWEMERVECDAASGIRSIRRTHPAQERRSTLRPAGLYLFNREILDCIPKSGYFDLKEQLFPLLYQQQARTAIWEIPSSSRTITSLGDFFNANLDVLSGQVPAPLADTVHWLNDSGMAEISPSARVFGPTVVGPGSRVGHDAIILGPSAIGARCEVEDGAVINECVVLDNARIKRGASLRRCVVRDGLRWSESR